MRKELQASALAALAFILTAPARADTVWIGDPAAAERFDGPVQMAGEELRLVEGGWTIRLPRGRVLVHRSGARVRFPAADAAEDAALRQEALGDARASLRLTWGALDALLAGVRPDGASPEEVAPAAEVAIRRAHILSQRVGQERRFVARCDALLRDERLTPLLRDLLRTLALEPRRDAGAAPAALAAEVEALGCVTSFFMAGVFDNERGTGFDRVDFPERDPFDPTASAPGKKYPVTWRALRPDGAPLGELDLAARVRPTEQGQLYLLTYLRAEGETPVAIRVGSDDAVRVWVNRQELLATAARRPYRPDQDTGWLTLRPGWNQLLVKLSHQDGDSWRCRVRVTAPDGGRASGVRVATPEEIATRPEFQQGYLIMPGGAGDGRLALSAHLAASPEDWRAWFHLGYLHHAAQAHHRGEHPDRDALRNAVRLHPEEPHLLVFLAQSLNDEATYSVNKEGNAWRLALEQALRQDPEEATARALLASYYATELGNLDLAWRLLEPALARAPLLEAELLRIDLLEARGLQPLAKAQLRRLEGDWRARVAAGEADLLPRPLWERLIRQARADRRPWQLDERLTARLKELPGAPAVLSAASEAAAARGELTRARELAQRACAAAPGDPLLCRRLAIRWEALADLAQAEAALEDAAALAPDDADVVEALGRLAARRGDAARADALLARALELNPNAVSLREYVEFRARHGQTAAPFQAAWLLEAAPILAQAGQVPLDAQRTHRVLLRQVIDKVNPDGTKSTFTQELVRIENEPGARDLTTYGVGYQSDQRLTFLTARLHRRGAAQDVPVGVFRERPGQEFTSRLSGGVRFPPLEPGDVLEMTYRVDDLEQGFFGDYYGNVVYLQDDVAIDRLRFVLLVPKGRTFYFHTPGLDRLQATREERAVDDSSVAHVFDVRGVPPLDAEPNQPWAKELLPQVQVCTFKDWDAFARWYWGLVKDQHEADPAIKAKVAELVAGAQTDEDKIRRIYNFVVTDIRYNAAWEFGVHGFKPYNATRIYARKFGDCKDKATLINTMLREVGIRSWPVLIFGENMRGKEDLALPLLGHFNHCISWVDFGEGGLFLDGTAEHHPFKTLPTMDYGATVVVVTPDKGLVREIPYRDPGANMVREEHVVKLGAGGSATLNSIITGTGDFGVVLRSWLATEGRRAQVIEPQLGRVYSGARVKEVRCSDLRDIDQPARVEVEVELPRITQPTTGGKAELMEVRSWLFDLVYLRGQKLSGTTADAEREQDLILPVPSGVEERVIYELPPGTSVRSLPSGVKLETEFGHYERTYRMNQGRVEAVRVLRFPKTRVPAERYAEFRGFLSQVEQAEAEHPVLGEGGTEQ